MLRRRDASYVVAVEKAGNRGSRAKEKYGDGSRPAAQAITRRVSVLPNLSPNE